MSTGTWPGTRCVTVWRHGETRRHNRTSEPPPPPPSTQKVCRNRRTEQQLEGPGMRETPPPIELANEVMVGTLALVTRGSSQSPVGISVRGGPRCCCAVRVGLSVVLLPPACSNNLAKSASFRFLKSLHNFGSGFRRKHELKMRRCAGLLTHPQLLSLLFFVLGGVLQHADDGLDLLELGKGVVLLIVLLLAALDVHRAVLVILRQIDSTRFISMATTSAKDGTGVDVAFALVR